MNAVEELCETHRHLPVAMCRWVAAGLPPYVDAEDLEPAAWDGLFQAASTFNPVAGVKFEWWAKRRIHGAIRDQLRRDDPMPRARRSTHREVLTASDRLAANLHRMPTDREVADALAVSAANVREVWAELASTALPPASLDHPAMAAMASPGEAPDAQVVRGDLAAWVRAAVDALPRRHRDVIYGVYWEGVAYRDVAVEYGVTESRVSQIVSEGVAKMRDALAFHLEGQPGQPLAGVTSRRRDAYRQAVAVAYRRQTRRETA